MRDHNVRGCACLVWILIFNLIVGSLCFSYDANFLFGVHVPWYLAVLGGVFLGEVVVPVTVICSILSVCGVHSPVF